MKSKIINLTDYSLESWEGLQFFNLEEAKGYIKRYPKLKKRAFVDKDVKPSWYGNDKWKQTYTIRNIDKQSKNVKKAIKDLIKRK